ncbi:MAG: exodeoxyribonuclease V subunit gamma [Ferrimonas sp.]
MSDLALPAPAEPLTNGLMMLHSNQIEQLRDLVVDWLKLYPLAPLEPEIFLVQSNGMAQWLKLALAADSGHGIVVGAQMQLPSRFIWQLYRTVLGSEAVPKVSPFDKPQLRWRILRLLPELLEKSEFAPLARFLAGDQILRKRDQLAEQLADLFDQYQVYRADWLAEWAAGGDVVISGRDQRNPLPPSQLWQPLLWRALLADMPVEQRGTSRASLHQQFLTALQQGRVPANLPRRLVIFGISTLPQQTIEALAALAGHCQVLLCINNPCQHFWGDIIEDKDLLRKQLAKARHQRKAGLPAELDESQQHNQVNPLLASWGKQGRDYIGLLYEYDQPEHYQANFQQIDLFSEPTGARLLTQVQRGIFDLTPLPACPKKSEDDDSITLVVAHSRQREVEILQDQLLARFAAEPTLRPADVIVMMPDVAQYAPHIEAVFGRISSQDPRYLPFTIADRGQRGQQVLLLALETLFDLTNSRFAVSELLDLLAVPALRARFNISELELPLLQRWVEQAGIRWGLHGEQRQQLALPEHLEQNTWAFGLKRMLLGYAVGTGEAWQQIEPCDEIGGLDAALVGKLAALLDTLESLWRFFCQLWQPDHWAAALSDALDALFVAQDEIEATILNKLKHTLSDWRQACAEAQLIEPLPLSILQELCLAPFESDGVSQRFLAGKINFCTLMPMRAIPFEQVCLLGLNDEDYPRSRPPLDFDLMSMAGQLDGSAVPVPLPSQYRPGDRSRREDDRYLFLEALLAARRWISFSYIGFSARDNSERTPSVLLGQLLDHLQAGYARADGRPLLLGLTEEHPLQPFSRGYFDGQSAFPSGKLMRSFAHEWQQVHQSSPIAEKVAPLTRWEPTQVLNFVALLALLNDPAKLLFNRRLGVHLEENASIANDLEPFELNGLSRYQLRQQWFTHLRQAGIEGQSSAFVRQLQQWRGQGALPIGLAGDELAQSMATPVVEAYRRVLELQQSWQPQAPQEVRFSHQGIEFEDWLTTLHRTPSGEWVQWQVLPEELSDTKGQLKRPIKAAQLYLQHLTANLQLTEPQAVSSYLVSSDGIWVFAPISGSDARQQLQWLLETYQEAMSKPLPISSGSGCRYIQVLQDDNGKDSVAAMHQKALTEARKRFDGDGYISRGERFYNPYLSRCWEDFSELPTAEFEQKAEQLYGDLVRGLKPVANAVEDSDA